MLASSIEIIGKSCIYSHLDNFFQTRASGLKHSLGVLAHTGSFLRYGVTNWLSLAISGDLAGQEDETATLSDLGLNGDND